MRVFVLRGGLGRSLLNSLNSGKAVSEAELNWFLARGEESRLSEKGLNRLELLAAAALWLHHVEPMKIHARVGRAMLVWQIALAEFAS